MSDTCVHVTGGDSRGPLVTSVGPRVKDTLVTPVVRNVLTNDPRALGCKYYYYGSYRKYRVLPVGVPGSGVPV